jgi:hypothetical protein
MVMLRAADTDADAIVKASPLPVPVRVKILEEFIALKVAFPEPEPRLTVTPDALILSTRNAPFTPVELSRVTDLVVLISPALNPPPFP